MPQRKAAVKRLRADKKRHLRNIKIKTELKKTIKKFLALVASKNLKEAQDAFKQLVSKLDKATLKGILHKNTASRRKSKFSRYLKSIT